MSPTVAPASPLAGPMALLGSGVPLTLLLDLVFGPHSEELLRAERAERHLPQPRRPG